MPIKIKNDDGTWTEDAKRAVWSKAPLAQAITRNPDVRLDSCKALMLWDDYGRRDSNYGWEIDHIVPEKFLQYNGVPQELIDDIDNLRPMHWSNNCKKADDFPQYSANTTHAGSMNCDDVYRDYSVNRDQINVLRQLFADYIDIKHPTVLGQWQVLIDRSITPTRRIPATFFDDIVTQSIHDLD